LVACPVRGGDFLAGQLASFSLVLDGGLPSGARRFFLVGKRLATRKPPALKCSFVDHNDVKKPAEAGKTKVGRRKGSMLQRFSERVLNVDDIIPSARETTAPGFGAPVAVWPVQPGDRTRPAPSPSAKGPNNPARPLRPASPPSPGLPSRALPLSAAAAVCAAAFRPASESVDRPPADAGRLLRCRPTQ